MSVEKKKEIKPRLPVFIYYIIILVAVFLIWRLLMPGANKPVIKEISYKSFIDMVENGEVEKVEIDNTTITIVPKELDKKNPIYYETGLLVVEDQNLVATLIENDVDFGSPIETSSMLLDLLWLAVMSIGSCVLLFIVMRIMSLKE